MYFETNNIKFTDRGGDKIQHCCLNPLHQEINPSAFTKIGDDLDSSFCKCSSCGYYMSGINLLKFLGGSIDQSQAFKQKMDKLFKGFLNKDTISDKKEDNLVFLPPKYKHFEINYRGISPETFKKVGAYLTNHEHYYKYRIIFPLIDINNTLKGFDAVSVKSGITPKVLRSKNTNTTEFFGFENLLKDTSFKKTGTLFICEGLFSSLSFIELGYRSVFNFGVGNISDKLKAIYQSNVKVIVLCGDNDEVGRKFNSDCYHLLKKSFKVVFFKYPYNAPNKADANDLLKEGSLQKQIDIAL